jgi:hypothetical protein
MKRKTLSDFTDEVAKEKGYKNWASLCINNNSSFQSARLRAHYLYTTYLETLLDNSFTINDIEKAYRTGWSVRDNYKTEYPPYYHNDSSWGENDLKDYIKKITK